eukprot:scaffold13551_cov142-Isochrysis_galbana.AAC.1
MKSPLLCRDRGPSLPRIATSEGIGFHHPTHPPHLHTLAHYAHTRHRTHLSPYACTAALLLAVCCHAGAVAYNTVCGRQHGSCISVSHRWWVWSWGLDLAPLAD